MIPIADLQIGNRVLYDDLVEAIICGIRSPYPDVTEKFNNKATVDLVVGGILSATEDEVEPIKLTKEVLVNCGFDVFKNPNNTDSLIFRKNKLTILFDLEYNKFKLRNYHEIACDLKYLHELQNLYKSLTKQDLIP